VLPRLFRRIAEFWRQQGAPDAAGGRSGSADWDGCFREFLEQRERGLRLRPGGPLRAFAEQVEIHAGRCRLLGQVENFLYQSCLADQKLT